MAKSQASTDDTFLRVPLHTVILSREGKRVIPQIGLPFAFTQKEIDDIEMVNKGALRAPSHEGVQEAAEPLDANRIATEQNREPARDTRTPTQKKKDDENAAKEAKATAAKGKPAKGAAAAAADKTDEI